MSEHANPRRMSVGCTKDGRTRMLMPLIYALLFGCGSSSTPASPIDGSTSDAGVADAGSGGTDGAAPDSTVGTRDAGELGDATLDTGPDVIVSPTGAGPHTIEQTETEIVRDSRTTPVAVRWAEGHPSQPLVVMLPGFQADGTRYTRLLDRIASHGFIIAMAEPPDPFVGISHLEMTEDVVAVIDWALDAARPFHDVLDASSIALMGHSLGGKIATMGAFRDARVTALLGLDPVNAGNPITGYSDNLPNIVPSHVGTLEIPIGLLGETTDATSDLGPACAPGDQNYQTFYSAATASPWVAEWTFPGADHLDFFDSDVPCGVACAACRSGTADEADVTGAVRTLSVAFLRRHLRGELEMEDWLTGDAMPALVSERHRP